MAKSVDDAEFWLPSQFLTAENMLRNRGNNKNGGNADLAAAFCFPSEFPYEFDSFGVSSALSSPVESVASSTETESSDEEDFFAGLTRRLSQAPLNETRNLTVPSNAKDKIENLKVAGFARSPQSILGGIGSWSGRSVFSGDGSPNGHSQVPSPPTTPFAANDDAWDVIYAVAGQVARLKMNEVSRNDYQNGLLGPPRAATPVTAVKNLSAVLYSNQGFSHNPNQSSQARQEQMLKQQCAAVWGRQEAKGNWLLAQRQLQQHIQNNRGPNIGGNESGKCVHDSSLQQSVWPPLRVQHQNHSVGPGPRGVRHVGSAVKRSCGGTGVFLPRQYTNHQEPRNKTGCGPVLLPAKVVQALNLNIDHLNATSSCSSGFVTDYDTLVARRNALLMQQRLKLRPEEAVNHELRLPQEWTY